MHRLKSRWIGDRAFYAMVLSLAVPIMIQNGITQFVSLLDNIMVGRIDEAHLRGVSVANTLIFVFNLAVFGAVSGAGIFGAQFFGSGNREGVQHAFRFKLLICAALTVLGTAVFLLFGDELIMLYLRGEGTEAERQASLVYARSYLRIILLSFLPFCLTQIYSGTLRECGQTVVPMVAGIVSVAVNLCFNTLLIFGYCGFPKLGSDGAAIATVLARYVEMAVVMLWTHRNPEKNPFIVGVYRTLRLPKQLAWQITKKTTPLMINETLWALGVALLSQCYSLSGLDVVAANNICSTVTNVFSVVFLALGNSIGIIIGQLLGADRIDEAKDADRKLIFFAVSTTVVIAAILAALSGAIPQIYEVSDGVRSLAAKLLLVAACTMPFDCLANACYFTIRSGGKTLVTMFFDSFYGLVFTTPLAYLLRLTTGIDIVWLYAVCRAVELGKGVVGLILIKRGYWIHNIVKDQSNEHRVLPEA